MTLDTFSAVKTLCMCGNWHLSNLELQKILYLAHRTYMGKLSESPDALRPLIDKHFYAWMYGPVVPEVYHELKMFGADRVHNIGVLREAPLPDKDSTEFKYLEKVYDIVRKYPPHKLVEMTHLKGGAWSKHYRLGGRRDYRALIPNLDIYNEFKEATGRRNEQGA